MFDCDFNFKNNIFDRHFRTTQLIFFFKYPVGFFFFSYRRKQKLSRNERTSVASGYCRSVYMKQGQVGLVYSWQEWRSVGASYLHENQCQESALFFPSDYMGPLTYQFLGISSTAQTVPDSVWEWEGKDIQFQIYLLLLKSLLVLTEGKGFV